MKKPNVLWFSMILIVYPVLTKQLLVHQTFNINAPSHVFNSFVTIVKS